MQAVGEMWQRKWRGGWPGAIDGLDCRSCRALVGGGVPGNRGKDTEKCMSGAVRCSAMRLQPMGGQLGQREIYQP